MIARKLSFLAENISERAAQDDVLCPTELAQLAAAIRSLLPTVQAMEERPVPPAFRIVQGGAT